MNLAARARMRPVLYPTAILVAFVLWLLVSLGVSPYAAVRPLLAAVAIGLFVPWAAGLVVADRDLAGLSGSVVILLLLGGQSLPILVIGSLAVPLLIIASRGGRSEHGRWRAGRALRRVTTLILTAGSAILLVAVAIFAVQHGRMAMYAYDLAAEWPLRPISSSAAAIPQAPSVYLVLLDGYPRSDYLRSEFGIDNSGFVAALGERGFVVASKSRSNHTTTHLTLGQMFNYTRDAAAAESALGAPDTLARHTINGGRLFADLRGVGYEIVAVSPAYEHVALRQADRFIDNGQFNEFEWAALEVTALKALIEAIAPSLAADLHRSRVLGAFDATEQIAGERSARPRFVLTHIVSPHSPLVFRGDGSATDLTGFMLPDGDPEEIGRLGWDEYVRRFEGQIAFVSARTVTLVDRIIEADPAAVIVVFSDHGSGARWYPDGDGVSDADLRTANLLATRTPGRTDIIDDRSTLANVIPRILRTYVGMGPPDTAEIIYIWADEPARSYVFVRPD